jgi:hypothetical protein
MHTYSLLLTKAAIHLPPFHLHQYPPNNIFIFPKLFAEPSILALSASAANNSIYQISIFLFGELNVLFVKHHFKGGSALSTKFYFFNNNFQTFQSNQTFHKINT